MSIPKPKQRKKFQTWNQISRQLDRGGLTADQQKELWAGVYLDQNQNHEMLKFVKQYTAHQFIPPIFVVAAYTGARRSEILRSRIDDLNFDEMRLMIRKRKSRKDLAESYRFVPIHTRLKKVMLVCRVQQVMPA